MTSEEQPAKQRINMAHGFMKSVIRNQIDRDNYDKEVKAKQQQGKTHYRPHSSRTKKPELKTYVPPQRSRADSQYPLYVLEYEHKNGEIYTIRVNEADNPQEVAKTVGEKFDLSEAFVIALAQRIQEEVDKRTV